MRVRHLLLMALLSVPTACGWQLRGYEKFEGTGERKMERLHLRTTSDNRLFQAALKRQLKDMSIALDPNAEYTLVLGTAKTERRPLSYGGTGIPVQYQLIMTIEYAYSNTKQSALFNRSLIARRQYDFDIELVVAKNEEEQQLLQEMREELTSRIIASINDQQTDTR